MAAAVAMTIFRPSLLSVGDSVPNFLVGTSETQNYNVFMSVQATFDIPLRPSCYDCRIGWHRQSL